MPNREDEQLRIMETMMTQYMGEMGSRMMAQLTEESNALGTVAGRRMLIHRCLNLLESVLGSNVVAQLRADLDEQTP